MQSRGAIFFEGKGNVVALSVNVVAFLQSGECAVVENREGRAARRRVGGVAEDAADSVVRIGAEERISQGERAAQADPIGCVVVNQIIARRSVESGILAVIFDISPDETVGGGHAVRSEEVVVAAATRNRYNRVICVIGVGGADETAADSEVVMRCARRVQHEDCAAHLSRGVQQCAVDLDGTRCRGAGEGGGSDREPIFEVFARVELEVRSIIAAAHEREAVGCLAVDDGLAVFAHVAVCRLALLVDCAARQCIGVLLNSRGVGAARSVNRFELVAVEIAHRNRIGDGQVVIGSVGISEREGQAVPTLIFGKESRRIDNRDVSVIVDVEVAGMGADGSIRRAGVGCGNALGKLNAGIRGVEAEFNRARGVIGEDSFAAVFGEAVVVGTLAFVNEFGAVRCVSGERGNRVVVLRLFEAESRAVCVVEFVAGRTRGNRDEVAVRHVEGVEVEDTDSVGGAGGNADLRLVEFASVEETADECKTRISRAGNVVVAQRAVGVLPRRRLSCTRRRQRCQCRSNE